MNTKEYRIAVTTKLKPVQADELKNMCDFGGISQSTFIREAIVERLRASSIPNVAGSNVVEFDPRHDSFTWKVRLDDGTEKTILEHVSKDFIEDLLTKLKGGLEDRNRLLVRRSGKSVAVPRRLVK